MALTTIILKRVTTGPKGTQGVLIDDNVAFALTLEDEWLHNQKNISCIPAGDYTCKRVDSPKFGDVFEITNVDDRTHILIHWGNRTSDTLGCPLVGEEFGILAGESAVLSSKKGFSEFMRKLKGWDEFMLSIRWT